GSATLTTGLIDGGGSGGAQFVNQEGLVLVPASAARNAGLSGQAINTGYSSYSTGLLPIPTGNVPIIPIGGGATTTTTTLQAQPSTIQTFYTRPTITTSEQYSSGYRIVPIQKRK
ncbi:hypothetical protein BLA29_013799, partial [Euroglyphus maynei]